VDLGDPKPYSKAWRSRRKSLETSSVCKPGAILASTSFHLEHRRDRFQTARPRVSSIGTHFLVPANVHAFARNRASQASSTESSRLACSFRKGSETMACGRQLHGCCRQRMFGPYARSAIPCEEGAGHRKPSNKTRLQTTVWPWGNWRRRPSRVRVGFAIRKEIVPAEARHSPAAR